MQTTSFYLLLFSIRDLWKYVGEPEPKVTVAGFSKPGQILLDSKAS